MSPKTLRIGLISSVWVAVNDGRWHTVDEIGRQLRSPPKEVELILDFLTKYGFAKQSFGLLVKRYQLTEHAPSPTQTATMLGVLGGESERLSEFVQLYM